MILKGQMFMTNQSIITCYSVNTKGLDKRITSIVSANNIIDVIQRTSNFRKLISLGDIADYIIIYHKS